MRHSTPRRCRGTIIAYFLILISALTTGLLTTMALSAGEQSRVAGVTLKRDQCFYAAEAGVQNAYWMLGSNASWRAPKDTPLTRSLGNVSYNVTCIGDWNSAVAIASTATLPGGGGANSSSVTITAVASPTVIVPVISVGGNFNNGGNGTISGDVQVTGSFTTSGTYKETGSLYTGGTIAAGGSTRISGVSSPNTSGITVPVIDTTALRAQATQVIVVPAGGATISSINLGQGGLVYFQGGPINFKGSVNITGYGTILTDSDVQVHLTGSVGSSNTLANVNIACGGNMTISGYLGIIGSLYVNGSISHSGGLDVTGVIVAGGDLNFNGGFSITRAQPPSWDPRFAAPGSMVLTRITGPIF